MFLHCFQSISTSHSLIFRSKNHLLSLQNSLPNLIFDMTYQRKACRIELSSVEISIQDHFSLFPSFFIHRPTYCWWFASFLHPFCILSASFLRPFCVLSACFCGVSASFLHRFLWGFCASFLRPFCTQGSRTPSLGHDVPLTFDLWSDSELGRDHLWFWKILAFFVPEISQSAQKSPLEKKTSPKF